MTGVQTCALPILILKTQSQYRNVKNIETQIVYLEADNLDQLILKFIPSNEQLNRTECLIDAVWQQVEELNFKDPDLNNQGLEKIENFEDFLLKEL